jgi:SAM-dependent methyltransferase
VSGLKRSLRGSVLSIVRRLPPPLDKSASKALRSLRDRARSGTRAVTTSTRRPSDLRIRLEQAFESDDEKRIGASLAELHALRARAEELASPAWVPDGVRLSETVGIQSIQFMIDLLPWIQKLMAQHPRGHRFEVLDVGPGTGLGTALLASLYRQANLGYRMNVSALDISRLYQRYIPAITEYVPFIREDVFSHEGTYDIVIASHVIEHLTDPVPFCRRLQELARLAVFIVTPFNEPADNLTKGHVGVIDEEVVKQLDPETFTVTNSVAWGAFHDPPYQMLIAQLPGKAGQGDLSRSTRGRRRRVDRGPQ